MNLFCTILKLNNYILAGQVLKFQAFTRFYEKTTGNRGHFQEKTREMLPQPTHTL